MKKAVFQFALVVLCVSLTSLADDVKAIPAFPGAEGFGSTTPGGRGGAILLVTNLNDSGPGSLRAACEAEGPRIVVFRTGGIIELHSPIKIKNPFITIAGQSAPGGGICLKNDSCSVSTHDVVIRYLRFRPGDIVRKEFDALWVSDSSNVVIDHCSTSWGTDETLSVTEHSRDVTVQWCIISESLNNSVHSKGAHGYGSLLRAYDGGFSFHHNLYADHNSRNPRPGGYPDQPGLLLDFRNNVIYNWRDKAGYTGDDVVRISYVGNYLKFGPSTPDSERGIAFSLGGPKNRLYARDNVIEARPVQTANNLMMLRPPKDATREDLRHIYVFEPFPVAPVRTDSTEVAFARVIKEAGATLPERDAVDRRVVDDLRNERGKIIDTQASVGGWPSYSTGKAPEDSDNDGMADSWETLHKLNPKDPADASKDDDGDGYTNIEEFLNGTDPELRMSINK